jgi:murein DD-endopeptidase MepM/ murein hydrolase activator NlpD
MGRSSRASTMEARSRFRPMPESMGVALSALILLVAAAAGVSCGQRPGVHRPVVALGEAAIGVNNGENRGPATIVVKTIKTIMTKGSKSAPGPFKLCPVQGNGYFSDDFGAPRFAGGFHLHAGNDIVAPMGTPIVAPFDGTASARPSVLGGNAVTVRGSEGFAYNAHLVAYGKLGPVGTGDVVGYVGNTGDAQGGPAHDHFEWHPTPIPAPASLHVSPYGQRLVGGAVDPYPLLIAACAR